MIFDDSLHLFYTVQSHAEARRIENPMANKEEKLGAKQRAKEACLFRQQ